MENNFDINRFIEAQAYSYEGALEQIKAGRKTGHWMWYIFPQYYSLGKSSTSIKYAINSNEEAISYLNHPILGTRLIEITKAFLEIENKTAFEILGGPDDLKIKSSMTLFDNMQADNNIFESVLKKYFDGRRCSRTLKLLENNSKYSQNEIE